MIVLNDILLDEHILTQPFSCDVKKCKGACCTMEGGAGAPLRNDELDSIQASVEAALPYLSEQSARIIREKGWLIADGDGLATRCIDDRDCVFVFYDGDVAKCALERAYFNGESTFRKPLSCHLFPVRVADFGGDYLYYERIEECTPALARGEATGETVLTTTQSALERAYGSEWTHAAVELARHIQQDGND